MGAAASRGLPRRSVLPLTARPWRAAAYLLARLPLSALGALGLMIPAVAGRWSALVLAGLPLVLAHLVVALVTAPAERRAVVLLGEAPVPDPHPRADAPAGLAALRRRLGAVPTRRELAAAMVNAALAPVDVLMLAAWGLGSLALLAAPLLVSAEVLEIGPWTIDGSAEAWLASAAGLVVLVGGSYAVVGLAAGHAAIARELLGPRGTELRDQVTELTRSRLRLVDAFDVERRRIERDLHDGAQQELVTLAMTLDLARIELEGTEHRAAAELVETAHAQAKRTLGELRELISAIHPPSLVELGLPAAVRALAHRSRLPVSTSVELPHRLPAGVETAAYFVCAEALTNAAKHAGARAVDIDVRLDGDTLVVRIGDDGTGGADPDRGSGLAGLGDRMAAVGGRLTLSSPPGGPTVICADIPIRGAEGVEP